MADAVTSNAELAPTKEDMIAAVVQRELQFQAKLVPSITDVSQFAVKGARSISVPKLGSFAVSNRASGTPGDATVLSASVDKLDLDQNAYVAYIIDPTDEVQSKIDVQLEFARRAASAHGRYVDNQILSTIFGAGQALPSGTLGAITRDIVLEMRETLLKNDANPDDLQLVLGVDSETEMLKIAEFTRADIYGSSNIPAGMIGRVYGVPVMVHNGVAAQSYAMFEKSACAIGFQKQPNMSEEGANAYGTTAVRVALDQLFGTKGMQLGEKGAAATESALIVKDANV